MSRLHEKKELRDGHRLFQDRVHAGEVLSEMLAPGFANAADTLVLAVPSGGVPVGVVISDRLGLPFDLVIVRKLQIPGNTEAGFGALSIQGEISLNNALIARLGLSRKQIEREIEKVRTELASRNRTFRKNKPLPLADGKIILLVDDGLASGYTMISATKPFSRLGAKRIIVAVPTAPLSTAQKVLSHADEVFSPHIQSGGPFAVADAYRNWHDLTPDEVLTFLRQKKFLQETEKEDV